MAVESGRHQGSGRLEVVDIVEAVYTESSSTDLRDP